MTTRTRRSAWTAAREELRVEGAVPRVVAELAVLATMIGMLAGLLDGVVAVALYALVLLGQVVVRLAPLRPGVQAVTAVAMPAAAWAAMMDAYEAIWWLDLVAHVAVTGLLALLATAAVYRTGLLVPGGSPDGFPAGTTVLASALGMALAVLWEFGEWFGHNYLDPAIQVGYQDTIGDLAAGTLGAVAAGALYRRLTTREATP